MNTRKTYTLDHYPEYEVHGTAAIYKVDPPLKGYALVLASTVNNHFGLMGMGEYVVETALFPCNENSEADWSNPIQKFEDCHGPESAFEQLGYTRAGED